jgi:hypothetical protein
MLQCDRKRDLRANEYCAEPALPPASARASGGLFQGVDQIDA